MRIKASTVEAHQYGVVRRRGYDPAEVDAVMSRLVDTLREYEHITTDLESRLKEADESSEAIRRTFLTAQRTRDEMLGEANQLAASIRAEANDYAERSRSEADAMLTAATKRAEEIGVQAEKGASAAATDAETLLALTQTEAARITDEGRRQAEMRRAEASAEAAALVASGREDGEALVAGAIEETRRLREHAKMESEALLAASETDGKQIVADAQARAEDVVAEATQRAHEVITAARTEEAELNTRLGRLRTAVADIERELEKLASVTLERASFVGEVIDLESESADVVVDAQEAPPRRRRRIPRDVTNEVASTETASSGSAAALHNDRDEAIEPMVAVMAVRRGRAFADPDGSGTPPAERRMVDPEDLARDRDGGSTYYERHSPKLQERINRAEQDSDS